MATFTNCETDFFRYHGNDAEMNFEEEDFDGFLEKIAALEVERVGEDLKCLGDKELYDYMIQISTLLKSAKI